MIVAITIFLTCIFAILTSVFVVEIIAASFLKPSRNLQAAYPKAARQERTILIPAHNESDAIVATINSVRSQLQSEDRILVVADNCSDDTVARATAAGAEVIERKDNQRVGKGYALDFGLQHLCKNPPHIVIMIDADCIVDSGAICQLVTTCVTTGRPAQALYLMTAPDISEINYKVAEFAWRVKNWIRPLGLNALRLPCQLVGSGMAFTWDTITTVNLANRHLVEDLQLGLDLAVVGKPPVFCPLAVVKSHFPSSSEGAQSQRQRWEHGHIGIIWQTPRLIFKAIRSGNLALLALALDIAVPPVSLFAIVVVSIFAIAVLVAYFFGSYTALALSAYSLFGFVGVVSLAWLKFGRDILPPHTILSIVPYVFSKLPLYRQVLAGKSVTQWTRTDRRK